MVSDFAATQGRSDAKQTTAHASHVLAEPATPQSTEPPNSCPSLDWSWIQRERTSNSAGENQQARSRAGVDPPAPTEPDSGLNRSAQLFIPCFEAGGGPIGLGAVGPGQGLTQSDFENWARLLGFDVGAAITAAPSTTPLTATGSDSTAYDGSADLGENSAGMIGARAEIPGDRTVTFCPPDLHGSSAPLDELIRGLTQNIVQGNRDAPVPPAPTILLHSAAYGSFPPISHLPLRLTSPSRYALHRVDVPSTGYQSTPVSYGTIGFQPQHPFLFPLGTSPPPLSTFQHTSATPTFSPLDFYMAGATAGREVREMLAQSLTSGPTGSPCSFPTIPPTAVPLSPGRNSATRIFSNSVSSQSPAPIEHHIIVKAPRGGGRPVYWTGQLAQTHAHSPLVSNPNDGDENQFRNSDLEESFHLPEREADSDLVKSRKGKRNPQTIRARSPVPAPPPPPLQSEPRENGSVRCGVEGCGEVFENWNGYRVLEAGGQRSDSLP